MSQRQSLLEQFEQRKKQLSSEKEYLKDQIHTHQIHNEVLSKQKRDFEKQQKEIEQTLLQLQQNVKKLYAEKENISEEQKKELIKVLTIQK